MRISLREEIWRYGLVSMASGAWVAWHFVPAGVLPKLNSFTSMRSAGVGQPARGCCRVVWCWVVGIARVAARRDMAIRVGINGFGRMGRLAFRAGWGSPEIEFVHINEIGGDGATSAHLLYFDSVHGRWNREVRGEKDSIHVDGQTVGHSSQ